MTEPQHVELTDSSIKAFLETAPLYSWRAFQKPAQNRTSLGIQGVDIFCEVCQRERPFHDMRARGGGSGMNSPTPVLKSGTSYLPFTCVSCRKSTKVYLVEQEVSDATVKLQKYGELPRAAVVRDRVLQKFLQDDRENYQKASMCLAHEYGVGAFAYFRRIVENNISRLLDLLQQEAAATGGDAVLSEALGELKKDTPMSEKIRVANHALPAHLKPDGLNPLGRLYQVLSEGVHALSDAECLAKAQAASHCLTYLVDELTTRKEHREQFKRAIGGL